MDEADSLDERPAVWTVYYISCEGNRRWVNMPFARAMTEEQVRDSIQVGGIGDDIAEVLEVERTCLGG